MELVDWHTHIWLPEHLGPEWGRDLDLLYSHAPSLGGSPEAHRAAMDAAGVHRAVVLALCSRYFDLDVPNEFVASYVESDPNRLIGFASVDPNDPEAPARLRYAVLELGLRGVKLAPPYQNFHPHAPEAYAVYREADRLGVAVMFHQGAVSHRRGVLDHAQPHLLDKIARDFPNLRIIIAHLGQPWSHQTIALLRKHPHVYADLSARCARPWQLRSMLLAALDYGVQGKLLFGSDFPVFQPIDHIRDLRRVCALQDGMQIPERIVEDILTARPLSLLDR